MAIARTERFFSSPRIILPPVSLFDKRGTGMSDRGSQVFALEQRMHDVQAILDEVVRRANSVIRHFRRRPNVAALHGDLTRDTHSLADFIRFLCQTFVDARIYPIGWKDEQLARGAFNYMEHNWGSPQSLSVAMRVPSVAGDRSKLWNS